MKNDFSKTVKGGSLWRFYSFLLGQFLGAANDNSLKMTLILVVLSQVPNPETQVHYSALANAIMPFAFLVFSKKAGELADRHSKKKMLLYTKIPEIFIMVLAVVGLYQNHIPFLFFVLFLLVTHSTFFSPPKYGILPELFKKEELTWANSILNMSTQVAILLGSFLGIFLYHTFQPHIYWAAVVYTMLAILGTLAVSQAPWPIFASPPSPEKVGEKTGYWAQLCKRYRAMQPFPRLKLSIFGLAYFYGFGSLFMTTLPLLGSQNWGLKEEASGLLLTYLSLGVALGSVLLPTLLKIFKIPSIESFRLSLSVMPYLALVTAVLSFLSTFKAAPHDASPFQWAPFVLLVLGFLGGVYVVPMHALLQSSAPPKERGRWIGFSNWVSFLTILVAAGLPSLLRLLLHFQSPAVLRFTAVVSFGVWFLLRLPFRRAIS